ncbi:TrmH family RNA methyltransferase [Hutsoniella sourekii]|uniref:TrmH family RNA methyltransferase n=1 Tax=Hutsoniella sourekii TaxID=87650 RepID=UPI0004847C62|nr:RNA methyltransferase [Hutsoniella sourekii]
MEEIIQSSHNQRVKDVSKLHLAKHRRKQQRYLIEGDHLLEEAITSGQDLLEVFVSQDYQVQSPVIASYLETSSCKSLVSKEVFMKLSQVQAPQGILAVLPMMAEDWVALLQAGRRFLIVDQLQDPGNLGTIIRTADAANYDGVFLSKGTVDLYNDKTLRSTQGSLWHLPVVSNCDLEALIPAIKEAGVRVLATALNQQAQPYQDVDSAERLALIMGNEGQGVSRQWVEASDQAIYIPMPGQAESLNVGVATGILLFHFL